MISWGAMGVNLCICQALNMFFVVLSTVGETRYEPFVSDDTWQHRRYIRFHATNRNGFECNRFRTRRPKDTRYGMELNDILTYFVMFCQA